MPLGEGWSLHVMGGQTPPDTRPNMVPSRRSTLRQKKVLHVEKVQDWVQPITKQLYWCAESSKDEPDEILSKWMSLVGHVAVCLVHQPSAGTLEFLERWQR